MHQVNWAESALDYRACRYGSSRMLFRGPKKKLKDQGVAFLGGSETFGKFVGSPYPELVGDSLGEVSVNLGCHNAGLDAILQDEQIVSICNRSKITVVQIMGAANLSNSFYTVHPRRNDRFIQASPMMERLFPDVDFMEFNYTHHLLGKMKRVSPEGYQHLVRNLQETWVVRMSQLINRLQGKVILAWFANQLPTPQITNQEPLFVTQRMLERVKTKAAGCVEIAFSHEVTALGTEGMHYLEHEHEAAKKLPNPIAHQEIADALLPVIQQHLR
jgi:hypothetical protein